MLKLSESSWDCEEIDAINRCVLDDNLTMGMNVKMFEKIFANYIGSNYAVMCNSGSSANLLAAAALKIINAEKNPKNIVLVPALSWSTTYFPWIQNGYRLKFIDVDRASFGMDLRQLEKSINNFVVGICVPHILGNDSGIHKILEVAKDNNLWVVEDTCESLGAVSEHNNLKLGSQGFFGTFSFFRSHHISTIEGGMIVTNDKNAYDLLRSLRAHGWAREISNNQMFESSKMGEWERKFKFFYPGYNVRPLEISGAIGLEQMKKLDKFVRYRKQNAEYLTDKIKGLKKFKLQQQDAGGSWMAFGFYIEDVEVNKKEVINKLESSGIETRPIVTGNFVMQPVMKNIKESCIVEKSYPQAEYLDARGFMVANHGRDLRNEIDVLVKCLSGF